MHLVISNKKLMPIPHCWWQSKLGIAFHIKVDAKGMEESPFSIAGGIEHALVHSTAHPQAWKVMGLGIHVVEIPMDDGCKHQPGERQNQVTSHVSTGC
jgi:hypothetical protein